MHLKTVVLLSFTSNKTCRRFNRGNSHRSDSTAGTVLLQWASEIFGKPVDLKVFVKCYHHMPAFTIPTTGRDSFKSHMQG